MQPCFVLDMTAGKTQKDQYAKHLLQHLVPFAAYMQHQLQIAS